VNPASIQTGTVKAVWHFLEELGIPRNGLVLIHSSFKSISRQGYRAEEILAAMVDYMEPGTLLMPAMSWRAVNPQAPVFDELHTPAITGILTELFRRNYATRRSIHPTHSVAGRGRLVGDLLAYHHLDETPCSDRSPWGLLDNYHGYVLLLGVEMDTCTLVHHLEETFAPHLYLQPHDARERYLCRDRNGSEVQVYTRRHLKLARNFWQFEEMLAADKGVSRASLFHTPSRAFAAADMTRTISGVLASNPAGTIARPGQRSRVM
jgi:aminoglycoside 3-N-acetyltransferase